MGMAGKDSSRQAVGVPQLCYSGLNSGISFLDEVFHFAARNTLALFYIEISELLLRR
jgi:hypothetical protein